MNINYYKTKPVNLYTNKQLFSEDVNFDGAKQYFFTSHQKIFNSIQTKNKCNYYEDNTYCSLIKLHFDIDFKQVYEHAIYKKQDAEKIINVIISKINSRLVGKYPSDIIQSIIWISDGLNKL